MLNPEQFQDKVILLVGAASGMGRASAELFAQAGATIIMGDVNPQVDKGFVEISEKVGPVKGFSTRLDVTDYASCQAVVERTIDEYGRIDVLANFAGVIQVAAEVAEMPVEEWDRVMDINLKGHFLMAKATVPHFRAQKSGNIIMIASIWGREGWGYFSAYCASKGGLTIFTHSLAKEMVRYNVRVNSIAPGMINTELHQKSLRDEATASGKTYDEVREKEWAKIPMGYAGSAEQIATTVLFLASEEASYMTGAILDVNGGILMR